MVVVSKCCFCFSLKYGCLTYGVLCLVLRVCIATAFLVSTKELIDPINDDYRKEMPRPRQSINQPANTNDKSSIPPETAVGGAVAGWFIATSVALFIALKGIIQKRSILLYPYIVVLIFESVIMVIGTIIEGAAYSASSACNLVIFGVVDVYASICIISLYQHMKQKEGDDPVEPQNSLPKTV